MREWRQHADIADQPGPTGLRGDVGKAMKGFVLARSAGLRPYSTALVRSGWAWLLAAVFVSANMVAAIVSVADGEQDPSFLIACLGLLALACWLFSRAHQLALRDMGQFGLLRQGRTR